MTKSLIFLFDNLDFSGADRVALNVANLLSSKGFRVTAAVCMDVNVSYSDLQLTLVRLSPNPSRNETLMGRIRRGLIALFRFSRLVNRNAIVICVTPPAAFVGAIAAWWSGARSIPWVHYDLDGFLRESLLFRGLARGLIQRAFYRYLVPMHSHLIFVSETTCKSMVSATRRGQRPSGWVVLPNIVNALERLGFQEESTSLTRVSALKNEGLPIFLFVGRITEQKRWGDVFAAAELFATRKILCNWVVIGDGPERPMLESVLDKTPLRNIHYLGADPNPIPSMALANALVLTSLYEAWPTVILEAFQLGIGVIAYDCPSGPREMIGEDQERGYLVTETPEAVCDAAAEMLSGSVDVQRRKAVNAKIYARRFEPDAALLAWQDYLDGIDSVFQDRRIDR